MNVQIIFYNKIFFQQFFFTYFTCYMFKMRNSTRKLNFALLAAPFLSLLSKIDNTQRK